MAAAGILVGGVGMGTAKAADLGGDCCADLEERVAELEATTVRKGNRKVSLTLSGQVNRGIMYYNDGNFSRTVAGVENRISSTRFLLNGDAKVTSRLKAGFEVNIEVGLGATTDKISNTLGYSSASVAKGTPDLDGGWGGDSALAVRTANWYLEDKDLGRLTIGRINAGGAPTTIDVAGIDVGATSRKTLIGNGIFFRSKGSTAVTSFSVTGATGACYGCNRMEGIRWDSQSLGGFLLQASWGENDIYTGSVRWAGEFGGFRLGFGAGVERTAGDANAQRDNSLVTGQANPLLNAGGTFLTSNIGALTVQSTGLVGNTEWSVGGGGKHLASGLFLQGHYAETDWAAENMPAALLAKGGTSVAGKKSSFWMLQGGVSKNYFGPGDTSIYFEYGEGLNNTFHFISGNPGGVIGAVNSSGTMMGAGINQKIDSAAMELYLAWNHYTLDVDQAGLANNTSAGPANTALVGSYNSITNRGGTAANTGSLNAIDTVFGGARIRF